MLLGGPLLTARPWLDRRHSSGGAAGGHRSSQAGRIESRLQDHAAPGWAQVAHRSGRCVWRGWDWLSRRIDGAGDLAAVLLQLGLESGKRADPL